MAIDSKFKTHKVGTLASTNVAAQKGAPKSNVGVIQLDKHGIVGDAHATLGHRQVSILTLECLARTSAHAGKKIEPGTLGENLTLDCNGRNDALMHIAPLDKFKIGDEVVLEVTQIGKKCHGKDVCKIYSKINHCPCTIPSELMFCRVLRGGKVKVGDVICLEPRPLKILIITLSDRAFQHEYEDESGPTAEVYLHDFFRSSKWHVAIERALIPDDADELLQLLQKSIADGIDLIFTLGGTGVGPRDITPEVVTSVAQKIVPGIMEHIRLKYAVHKKAALLSRSIVAIANKTQIYTLPGSPKAVSEYLHEITPLLDHMLCMLNGLGH